MIRQSIEQGTKVFHLDYGIGEFKTWMDRNKQIAAVMFVDGMRRTAHRSELTELEEV